MASGLEIMKQHMRTGGYPGLGLTAYEGLRRRGWDPRQITALAPSLTQQVHGGWKIGEKARAEMAKYPNARFNIGLSGLYNIGTAQKWVGKGLTQDQIQAHGSGLANTPRGRESTRLTNRTGWGAGFTADAADWLSNRWRTDQEELEARERLAEASEEDPQWATDLSQTLTGINDRINEPAVDPTEMGGYSTASYVGDGGTTSLKIDKPKRGSRKTGTQALRRSSFSMPTTNTASGKASNNSAVNV